MSRNKYGEVLHIRVSDEEHAGLVKMMDDNGSVQLSTFIKIILRQLMKKHGYLKEKKK